MRVGVCQIEIFIDHSFSLKDKRRVVNSIKNRIKNRFNVSIIETGTGTNRKKTTIGLSCVGIDENSVRNLLNQIVSFLEEDDRLEITDLSAEIY
ncbi:MAG: uncharacterized protein PWP04_102 [Candidatus Atribacteria bacterium]|nr:uncharacterized protein [Candidatus Atribacteria bacterium]